jgi:hypothetical protein
MVAEGINELSDNVAVDVELAHHASAVFVEERERVCTAGFVRLWSESVDGKISIWK